MILPITLLCANSQVLLHLWHDNKKFLLKPKQLCWLMYFLDVGMPLFSTFHFFTNDRIG